MFSMFIKRTSEIKSTRETLSVPLPINQFPAAAIWLRASTTVHYKRGAIAKEQQE